MTKTILASILILGLAACTEQNASDEPTADTSSAGASTDATATTTPPSGNDSADATASGSGMGSDTGMGDTTGASGMGTDTGTAGTSGMGTDTGTTGTGSGTTSGMGGTSTGQTDATLDADLRRCDTMTSSAAATCRTEAQTRYEQRTRGSEGTR